MKRMNEVELAEHRAWLDRNGGSILPPGLHEGGEWLKIIREEIRKEIISGAFVQVRRQPPLFLRWLLLPWLRWLKPKALD